MDSSSVYTGFWKNHNESVPVLGLTLTLPRLWGAVLISFITMFVSAAMANLWSILCFVVHQYRSTPLPRTGLYHQQQALLCNAPSTVSTASTLLRLAWAWRGKLPHTVRPSLPLASTAGVYLALLSAAGLFSSRALLLGDEVLKNSGKCGWPDSKDDSTSALLYTRWGRYITTQAKEYVRNCYTPDVMFNTETCKIYTTPTLNISKSTTAQCPFSSDICAQSDALEIDTGYINSNTHLGINTAKDGQFLIRTIMTCAPILAEEEYSTEWSSSPPDWNNPLITDITGNEYKTYNLGRTKETNFTWLSSNYSMLSTDNFGPMYGLGAKASYAGFHDNLTVSDFDAIEDLILPQADTAVLFLSNSVVYTNATTDPWFRATSKIDQTGLGRPESTAYFYADRVISTVACTQQWELCTMDSCGSRTGKYLDEETQSWLENLGPKQQAVAELVAYAISLNIESLIVSAGSSILEAVDAVLSSGGAHISTQLPSNQWQNEIVHIFNIGLASTQQLIANYPTVPYFFVSGTDGTTTYDYVAEPEGELGLLCSAIRIRDSRFSNFSVLGLIIILAVGTLIIVVNLLVLPQAWFWLRRNLSMREHAQQEWQEGRLFMMQRSLLQSQGIGPWEVKESSDIPWISDSPVEATGTEDEVRKDHPKTKGSYQYLGVQIGI